MLKRLSYGAFESDNRDTDRAMMMKKHRGSKLKDGGMVIKDEDYTGHYALRLLTEQGEEFEFVLSPEELDRLRSLSEPPYGSDESEIGLLKRVIPWL